MKEREFKSIFEVISFSDSNYLVPADKHLVEFAIQRNEKLKKEFKKNKSLIA